MCKIEKVGFQCKNGCVKYNYECGCSKMRLVAFVPYRVHAIGTWYYQSIATLWSDYRVGHLKREKDMRAEETCWLQTMACTCRPINYFLVEFILCDLQYQIFC